MLPGQSGLILLPIVMDQDNSLEKSFVNLLTLPTELLVYIISFLPSLHDRVKLRYVSSWLKCLVEETPLLWKEFVWPYYDSREEYSVTQVLKVCGQHIRTLSFPNKVPSTLVEMLQYCSNVQHISLPSANPEQLLMMIHHIRHLQTLELKVDCDSDIEQLFLCTSHLKEITIISNSGANYGDLFKHWKEKKFMPPSCNVIAFGFIESLLDHTAQSIPSGTTASFRVFCAHSKVTTLPYFQIQIERSGQVTTRCAKLSDFGILGLKDDVVVMTDCQYGGKTVYGVSVYASSKPKLTHIAKPFSLKSATHVDLSWQSSLCSGHLEQVAVACPNLQQLNLQCSYHCLKSLQGLRAIHDHCQYLQGLNLLGICVEEVEDLTQLWEILSDMKLTHLALEYCVLPSGATNKERFISLLKKFSSVRAIELKHDAGCYYYGCNEEDTSILSCFPLLQYCYLRFAGDLPTPALEMVNKCMGLKCVRIFAWSLSLKLAYNRNLQQLCIQAIDANIPKNFMATVSAHGGLVHVIIDVPSLAVTAIMCLVRNSPKLITLYLRTKLDISAKHFNAALQKMFSKRVLFATGYCNITDQRGISPEDVMQELGIDLLPLWN